MPTASKINVFLSYTDLDYRRGVDRLKRRLESIETGYEVYSFRDHHPTPHLDFGSNVQSALEKAHFVVVLWSINAQNNPEYVLREIAIAKTMDKHILLVLLDDIKRPPPLFATEDGIRAFDNKLDWDAHVAEKLAVWVRHPPKRPVSYGASTAPAWLNGLKLAVCVGIVAGLGGQKLLKVGKALVAPSDGRS
jgi:TIR domain